MLPADAPPEREALHVGLALARQRPHHRPRLAHRHFAIAVVHGSPLLLAAMAGDQNILHGRQLKQEEKKTEGTQEYRSPPVSKPGVMHASVSCSWPGLCWLQLSSEEPIGGGGESSLIIIINKGIRAGTSESCQSPCHRASASRRPRRPPLPASRSIRGEETTEAEGPGACKRSRQTWRPIDVRVYGLRNWCAGRPLEQMNNGGAVLVGWWLCLWSSPRPAFKYPRRWREG